MKLDEFITTTLVDIAKGINASNNQFSEDVYSIAGEESAKIDFEVKLSVLSDGNVEMKTEASSKWGIFSGKVNLSGKYNQKAESAQIVKFSIVAPQLSHFQFDNEE